MRFFAFITVAVFITTIPFSEIVAQNSSAIFYGKVIDDKKNPIEFASIYYKEKDLSISSDENGKFTFGYSKSEKFITLKISFVGKKELTKVVPLSQALGQEMVFELEDFSLSLNEITVSPILENSKNSNSSIVYNREAIQQVQAFSLKDILNTLPGKETTAPDINNVQSITLRGGNQGDSYALNNSLGVAIIVDGITQSNDANMQSRSASRWGMAGSALNAAKSYGSTDVPYQGIDLREIPVESIEKLEIIQGVASAKYGELTDGAIIIERQAGQSPFQFTTNINGASTNYALTKGFRLNHNLGAINTNFNYARSNSDPRDKVQQYDRYSGTLMWTKNFSKSIKNTFTVDYNYKKDNVKTDPDDDSEQMSYSTNSNLRLSTRLNASLRTKPVQKLSFNLSLSEGHQESYKQWLLNQGLKAFSNKDTTGIYEGYFISGKYTAVEEIAGKPVTLSSDLGLSAFFNTGNWKHSITYGASYNYSNNGGKGIISDPDRPRWINNGGQNERPYSFESSPSIQNFGFYAEDNINTKLHGKHFNASLGLRHDIQNGYHTLQPRISTNYELNKNWQLNLAYGVSTKAPTLAHRYPSPTWIDITLLSVLNSEQALHLVYTERIDPDNSHLKPSKTSQIETGIRFKNKFLNASLFGYYKNNTNGFDTKEIFRPILLPEYAYEIVDSKLHYFQTGNTKTYTTTSDYQIYNLVNSKNYGVELAASTKKIPSLQTSFNFSTSFLYSSYFKDVENLTPLNSISVLNTDTVWYAIYPSEQKKFYSLMSKLGTTTHIPAIGIVININTDIFWLKNQERSSKSWREPIGYINNKSETIYFKNETDKEQGINILGIKDYNAAYNKQPLIYGIVNMSVAKEIKKNIRISLAIYNALSLHPEKYYINKETGSQTLFAYNKPTSITGGISIKF